jgi:hypothetical protein
MDRKMDNCPPALRKPTPLWNRSPSTSINSQTRWTARADQINVAVHRVNIIGGENKGSIKLLVQEVAKFKVE